ncbi:nucleotidyltransferase domain-containing protein, partial [Candidatus Sumerlaeota bacterium]|nr:nucleotidyltransferase domain-containing protein [Candidatus Sumerlaeota bacterium]
MGRKDGKRIETQTVDIVRRYLAQLPSFGIHATRAVLFGSFARGDANKWSDIDLIVIAPEFDGKCTMKTVDCLWRA